MLKGEGVEDEGDSPPYNKYSTLYVTLYESSTQSLPMHVIDPVKVAKNCSNLIRLEMGSSIMATKCSEGRTIRPRAASSVLTAT